MDTRVERIKFAISDLTKERGVRATYVANKIGISNSYLTRLMNGERDMTDDLLDKLEEFIVDYFTSDSMNDIIRLIQRNR